MEHFIVFAVIGLLMGAAARLLYPGRQVTHILSTITFGVIGAAVGGVISWSWWRPADGGFHTGNLVLAALGAVFAIGVGAVVGYSRSLQGFRQTSR